MFVLENAVLAYLSQSLEGSPQPELGTIESGCIYQINLLLSWGRSGIFGIVSHIYGEVQR